MLFFEVLYFIIRKILTSIESRKSHCYKCTFYDSELFSKIWNKDSIKNGQNTFLVLLIAGWTWDVAISPSMYKRGEQLYEQGKLFYNDAKFPSRSPLFHQENSDSSIINRIEKKRNE